MHRRKKSRYADVKRQQGETAPAQIKADEKIVERGRTDFDAVGRAPGFTDHSNIDPAANAARAPVSDTSDIMADGEAVDWPAQLSRHQDMVSRLQDELKDCRSGLTNAQLRVGELEQDLAARQKLERSHVAEVRSLRDRLDDLQRLLLVRTRDVELERIATANEKVRAEASEKMAMRLEIARAEAQFALNANKAELARLRDSASGRIVFGLQKASQIIRRTGLRILRRPTDHPLFDSAYYIATYPDVAASREDPFLHFMRFGTVERRNPNIMFDMGWYLDQNPDVAREGINPICHYHAFGHAEHRDPHPLFSTRRYVDQHPDVKSSGEDPLVHYLNRRKMRDCA